MDAYLNMGMNMLGNGGSGNFLNVLRQFDRNGDGRISEDDFVQAVGILGFGGIGDFAARQFFRQLDVNRNGILDFTEAIRALHFVQNLYSQQFGGNQMGYY